MKENHFLFIFLIVFLLIIIRSIRLKQFYYNKFYKYIKKPNIFNFKKYLFHFSIIITLVGILLFIQLKLNRQELIYFNNATILVYLSILKIKRIVFIFIYLNIIIIFASFFEEIIFRFMLIDLLRTKFNMNKFKSYLVSSIIFIFAHNPIIFLYPISKIYSIIFICLVTFILNYSRYKLNNIYFNTIIHSIINLTIINYTIFLI